MESWAVGFDGDADVERHAGVTEVRPDGRPPGRAAKPPIRIRVVSDYI